MWGSPRGGFSTWGVLHWWGSPRGGFSTWGVLHVGGSPRGGFSTWGVLRVGGSPRGGFSAWGVHKLLPASTRSWYYPSLSLSFSPPSLPSPPPSSLLSHPSPPPPHTHTHTHTHLRQVALRVVDGQTRMCCQDPLQGVRGGCRTCRNRPGNV